MLTFGPCSSETMLRLIFRAKLACDLATYPVPPASSRLLNTTSTNLKEFEHAVFSCKPGANLEHETRADVVSGKVGWHSKIWRILHITVQGSVKKPQSGPQVA